ncbi:hypothetical protein FRB99_007802 [Tulasnella sp. 403]|nr:hypothetical protein FRB99_007802 [Tulasnella sp. 403]
MDYAAHNRILPGMTTEHGPSAIVSGSSSSVSSFQAISVRPASPGNTQRPTQVGQDTTRITVTYDVPIQQPGPFRSIGILSQQDLEYEFPDTSIMPVDPDAQSNRPQTPRKPSRRPVTTPIDSNESRIFFAMDTFGPHDYQDWAEVSRDITSPGHLSSPQVKMVDRAKDESLGVPGWYRWLLDDEKRLVEGSSTSRNSHGFNPSDRNTEPAQIVRAARYLVPIIGSLHNPEHLASHSSEQMTTPEMVNAISRESNIPPAPLRRDPPRQTSTPVFAQARYIQLSPRPHPQTRENVIPQEAAHTLFVTRKVPEKVVMPTTPVRSRHLVSPANDSLLAQVNAVTEQFSGFLVSPIITLGGETSLKTTPALDTPHQGTPAPPRQRQISDRQGEPVRYPGNKSPLPNTTNPAIPYDDILDQWWARRLNHLGFLSGGPRADFPINHERLAERDGRLYFARTMDRKLFSEVDARLHNDLCFGGTGDKTAPNPGFLVPMAHRVEIVPDIQNDVILLFEAEGIVLRDWQLSSANQVIDFMRQMLLAFSSLHSKGVAFGQLDLRDIAVYGEGNPRYALVLSNPDIVNFDESRELDIRSLMLLFQGEILNKYHGFRAFLPLLWGMDLGRDQLTASSAYEMFEIIVRRDPELVAADQCLTTRHILPHTLNIHPHSTGQSLPPLQLTSTLSDISNFEGSKTQSTSVSTDRGPLLMSSNSSSEVHNETHWGTESQFISQGASPTLDTQQAKLPTPSLAEETLAATMPHTPHSTFQKRQLWGIFGGHKKPKRDNEVQVRVTGENTYPTHPDHIPRAFGEQPRGSFYLHPNATVPQPNLKPSLWRRALGVSCRVAIPKLSTT